MRFYAACQLLCAAGEKIKMALGTAVHDTECKPDNDKNATVEADNKKISNEQDKNAG